MSALRVAIGVALALVVVRVYWGTVFGGGGRRWYWPLKLLGMFLLYVCMMTVVALFLVLLWRLLRWGLTVPVLQWVLAVPMWGLGALVAAFYVVLLGYVVVALAKWFYGRINEEGKSKTQNLSILTRELIREHIWIPAVLTLLVLVGELLRFLFPPR